MKFLESIKKKLVSSSFFRDDKYKKYRVFFVPLFALVTAVLISVLVTVPQIYKLINTFKTIDELNQKKSFYQKKASELEAVNVSDYRNNLDIALVALPVEKDIPGIIGEILVPLGASGMRLGGISFSGSSGVSDKVEEYNITVDAAGTKTGLTNFLERITLAPRLIKLVSISVESALGGNLNTKLTFATFYQGFPSNINAVDNELPKINKEEIQILTELESKKREFPQYAQEASSSSKGKLDPFKP